MYIARVDVKVLIDLFGLTFDLGLVRFWPRSHASWSRGL